MITDPQYPTTVEERYLKNVYETDSCVTDMTTGEVFERERQDDADADERGK
ncbi:hypothetical protein [Amycolatopsis thermoflava]|uniref:hypothetical protein n=1 Tax=Amycolatopsis thermoflava TaxID=84480 RepID=UPI000424D73D|nr:hypothetical protein [Amycolatopsis thermoflava]